MSICYKHKFIFIHLQKTGGSSIHTVLGQLKLVQNSEKYLTGRISSDVSAQKFPYTHYWHHLKASDVRKIVSEEIWNTFFKFTFVRNPWDRTVSMFFYAKKSTSNPSSVHWGRHYPDKFEDWLREVHGKGVPQCNFITDEDGKLLVDFVGRFERLEEDFKRVCKITGLLNINLPHVRKSAHKHYSEYYTRQTRQFVADCYKKDIELFGYRFEDNRLLL